MAEVRIYNENIKYVNHLYETIQFGEETDIYINDHELRNYKWVYQADFGRVSSFRRELKEYNLTVFIFDKLRDITFQKNRVFEVFEKDVLANKQGKLWIDNYYLNCNIIATDNSQPINLNNFIQKDFTIIADNPVWVKETPHKFYIHQETEGDSSYPYDYPYGYSNNLNSQRILNDHFTQSNFKLIIYGAVTNPTVYINGYPYTVNTEVLEGEFLTISSLDKTVMKTKNNGELVNEFNKRSKDYSVFQKIKQGQNTVSYDGSFDFEVILFDERSEPKWT